MSTPSRGPRPATDDAPLASVPHPRRAILKAIKRNGTMTAQDLARSLGVSAPAVRQQLHHLTQDGLVARRSRSDGRGRPLHDYSLTPSAEALFPKRYGDLTSELLGYLGGPQSREAGRLFEERRRRRVAAAKERLAHLGLPQQVAELAHILEEDGYLAELETLPGGGWRIVEHNCAILTVAAGYRQACSSELAFIRDALGGARVERVAHLMDGGHVCAYEVRPLDPPAPG